MGVGDHAYATLQVLNVVTYLDVHDDNDAHACAHF